MTKEQLLSMDAQLLLSIINMKLRDQFLDLEDLCDDVGIDSQSIESKLKAIGYIYSEDNHQFISSEA